MAELNGEDTQLGLSWLDDIDSTEDDMCPICGANILTGEHESWCVSPNE